MEALRILIADDHPAVRILLRNILGTVPRWKVCGEAENGSSAVALGHQPSSGHHCHGSRDAGN